MKLQAIREKVKNFLEEAVESREENGEIRVIGIDRAGDHWVAEAEVAERNPTLPGYRLFEKKLYRVTLTDDLDIISYKQVKNFEEKEEG